VVPGIEEATFDGTHREWLAIKPRLAGAPEEIVAEPNPTDYPLFDA